jgi:ribosomal protein L11 methyltransferase
MHTQFTFENTNSQTNEILIALLANIGFDGFEETDNSLQAFIPKNEFNQIDFDEILNQIPTTFTQKDIEQQNWNAQWESSFEPVMVDDFAAVRASFHTPITTVKHEIVITPKMSFGTGHHATTFLMMQQMSQLNFTDKAVYDFGTGTGVLAILAHKMGATKIDTIDNDDWSIENAKENFAANNCSEINIAKADEIETSAKYDIILANINLNVITAAIASIAKICKTNAKVLFSGFLITDKLEMENLLTNNNFTIINVVQKGEWICILAGFHISI